MQNEVVATFPFLIDINKKIVLAWLNSYRTQENVKNKKAIPTTALSVELIAGIGE